jgi:hypothetical protein
MSHNALACHVTVTLRTRCHYVVLTHPRLFPSVASTSSVASTWNDIRSASTQARRAPRFRLGVGVERCSRKWNHRRRFILCNPSMRWDLLWRSLECTAPESVVSIEQRNKAKLTSTSGTAPRGTTYAGGPPLRLTCYLGRTQKAGVEDRSRSVIVHATDTIHSGGWCNCIIYLSTSLCNRVNEHTDRDVSCSDTQPCP